MYPAKGFVDYDAHPSPRKLSGLRRARYEHGMISGPASSSSIVAGVTWVEHALLGTAATAIHRNYATSR